MAESEYLRQTVGEPLAQCLAEVVLCRPHDPIEYIALWLYKHAANVQHQLQLAKEAEQLAKEIEEQKEAEQRMIKLLLEDEKLHQKDKEQVAKDLEEAQRLQGYHTDINFGKHGPATRVHSVPSIQHAYPAGEDDEQEEEEEEVHVHSQLPQNVDLEPELQTEKQSSEESEIQRQM